MTLVVPQTTHEFDAEGHLVREEDEAEDHYVIRTAEVLFNSGMSPNTPEEVAAQWEEPLPPDVGPVEGQSVEEYQAQQAEWKEEWEQRRLARIEEFNANAQSEREAKEAEKAEQAQTQTQEHDDGHEVAHTTNRRGRRNREE